MLKTVATTKSTIDLLLPYSQLINWHTTTPSAASNEHTTSQKNSTHLPKPLLVSAGISAIVIPRRHMAVIIKAKKQAYKMVCSPWGGLVDGRPTPTITT